MRRMLIWRGVGAWRAEVADVELNADSLRATGTQIGIDPLAYRFDYALDVDDGWVTRRLYLRASGADWARELDLRRGKYGTWSAETEEEGRPELPSPGGDTGPVEGALDCDLGLCPLTNVMPVRRHDLHRRPGEADFLMAWVSVPDLGLHPSRQRYEHVGSRDGRHVVRYVGEHRSFVGELELDEDGLVVLYPDLAARAA